MNLRSLLLVSSALLPHLACSTAIIELDTEGQTGTTASTSATDGGTTGTTGTSTATATASGTGASDGTAATTGESSSASGGTTGGTGEATSGTSGADTTTEGTSSTSDGTTTADTTTTEGTSSTTDATTGGLACADLDEKACAADPACMVIAGAPIDIPNACTKPSIFLECTDAMICGDAITYACPEGTKDVYEFLDTCIPADFVPCDPVKVNGPCK